MSRKTLLTGLATAAMLLTPLLLSAQQAVITGVVRGEGQQAVRGAVVEIQALDLRVLTNDQGRFTLTVPEEQVQGQQETIRVSSIGYRATEEAVTLDPGPQRVDITMAREAVALEQVLVTGVAGRQERRAQAASISSIDAGRLAETAPVTTVANVLQSRVPSLMLREGSGSAGTGPTMRIRGRASISLGNEPLVFIDGIRMDSRRQQLGGVGNQVGTRLNDLRPEDIESIEVVKGPAAATLYGSDASAGVIQIFTRRGQAGQQFTQQVSATYGFTEPNFTPPDNFAVCSQAHIEGGTAACQGLSPGTVISDNPLERYGSFRDGEIRGLTWSLRGGGESYGVYLSAGLDQEDGTLPSNDYGRMNTRANFDFMPSDDLRLDFSMGVMRSRTRLPHNDNNIYGYLGGGLLGNPLSVGAAADGWYAGNRQTEAIAAIRNINTTYRFMPNFQVNYTPRAWFSNRLTFGADLTRTEAHVLWPRNDQTWYAAAHLNTGTITQYRNNRNQVTLDYLGNIQWEASPDVGLDFSFGTQLQHRTTDNTQAQGQGLVSNTVTAINTAAETIGGQSFSEERQVGFLGQVQLSLWDRLYIQGAGRLDQHSAFGIDADPFFSPRVGVSYVLSDEDFWRDRVSPDLVSDLRIRAAYGTTGRSPTTGSRATYDAAPYALVPGQTEVGVIPDDPGNPELRPERGTEFEIGVEAGVWRDRIGLEVNYFRQETRDLILSTPLPPSLGFDSNPLRNIGGALNSGFEVSANAQLVATPRFAWEANLGFNTLNNEITDMGEVSPIRGNVTKHVTGFPMQGMWAHTVRDYERDGEGNPVAAIVSDTMEFVGNHLNTPGYEGNFGTTLTFFRNLSLYTQFGFRGDYYIYDNTAHFRERQLRTGERWVLRDEVLTPEEQVERFGPWITESGESVGLARANMAYIEPGDFVRLREVSLSLRVPDDFVDRYLPASGANISLTGRNLNTWTDYTGLDPETLQFLTVPQDRRWIARVNLTF